MFFLLLWLVAFYPSLSGYAGKNLAGLAGYPSLRPDQIGTWWAFVVVIAVLLLSDFVTIAPQKLKGTARARKLSKDVNAAGAFLYEKVF